MTGYLQSIWQLRYFWFSLIKCDLLLRYRRSFLGIGWSLLHPIGMTIVLCTVFHKLFGLDLREYGPFVLSGISFWAYVTTVVTGGCQAFFTAAPFVQQHPVPMAIYPLRTALGAGFHALLALGVVVAVTWVVRGFDNLPALLAVAPALLLLCLFGWALATLAGISNVHFPDTQHLSELLLQVLFYTTPILYKPEMLRDRGLGWLVDFNPIAALLEIVRAPILYGRIPDASVYATATVTVFLLVALAAWILKRVQKELIFRL